MYLLLTGSKSAKSCFLIVLRLGGNLKPGAQGLLSGRPQTLERSSPPYPKISHSALTLVLRLAFILWLLTLHELCGPIFYFLFFLRCWGKPEHPVRLCTQTRGEHVISAQKDPSGQELNLEPSCCEEWALTAVPPCCPAELQKTCWQKAVLLPSAPQLLYLNKWMNYAT